jgi:hypothetical protein
LEVSALAVAREWLEVSALAVAREWLKVSALAVAREWLKVSDLTVARPLPGWRFCVIMSLASRSIGPGTGPLWNSF